MESEDGDGVEDFENAFWHFINALRVLSHEAELQCEEMGSYNVGWEIKNNLLGGGREILGLPNSYLTKEKCDKIADLLASLIDVPKEALAPSYVSPVSHIGCMTAMGHPAWSSLRKKAKCVLQALEAEILRNQAYFRS